MALHFSTERPEDQFYTDFGNFNKFGEEVRIICGVHFFFTGRLAVLNNAHLYGMQAFSKLGTLVFNFLVDPQQVTIEILSC